MVLKSLIFVLIGVGIYYLFKRGGRFYDEMKVLERNVVFYTGADVEEYMNWCIAESVRSLSHISNYDKASAVLMSVRKAAERNKSFSFLSYVDANYKKLHSDIQKEIENIVSKKEKVDRQSY